MLFLGMKLIVTLPREGMESADNPLYTAAKGLLALLESGGCVSLLCLQGMVLVALYEYGQGIYPAAWMSVAGCARYAEMCGLPGFKESWAVLGAVVSLSFFSYLVLFEGIYLFCRGITLYKGFADFL